MAIVQEVITWWTKESRSAVGAALRNAVPEVFPVPRARRNPVDHLELIVHRLVFRESAGFKNPEESIEVLPLQPGKSPAIGCLRVEAESNGVRVVYAYDRECGGAPERTSLPRQVFTLAPGEWGQVRYNGRFDRSYTALWTYKQVIVNVAFPRSAVENPFKGEPKRDFEDVAELY